MELIAIWLGYIQSWFEKVLPFIRKLFLNQMICDEELLMVGALYSNERHFNFAHFFVINLKFKWLFLIWQFLYKFKIHPWIFLNVFDVNISLLQVLNVIEIIFILKLFAWNILVMLFEIKYNQMFVCYHDFGVFHSQKWFRLFVNWYLFLNISH